MNFGLRSNFPQLIEICGHTFIGDLIDSDSIVIDLGANIGTFSERIYSTYRCFVFAIEPIPQLYEQINSNEKVAKFSYCIATKSGPVALNTYIDRCASIYPQNDAQKNDTIVAKGITLDQFIDEQGLKKVDLLKVDIEGAELGLFDSLESEVLQKFKQITIEFHDFLWPDMQNRVELIKQKLILNGFYCISFSITNGDVLFLRKEYIRPSTHLYIAYYKKYVRGIKRIIKRNLESLDI